MSQIGSFALLLALGLSAYSFLAGLLALFRRDAASARLGETARRAGIASFGAVLLAAIVLITAAFSDDFSIAYIFHHSNRDLPAAYKFAVLWSGQEGSLLFWSLLLAGYGFVLRLRYKTDQRLFAHASVVIAAVQVFFLLILNFAAHPFGIIQGALPQDGTGLNPLLQYPEMVIHPPMLYLGYVGFTVPFAFALGALIMKYPGEKWIHITRRWTMVTWCFLTIGVFLGARVLKEPDHRRRTLASLLMLAGLTALALGVAVGAPAALVPHAAKSVLRAASTTLTGGLANPLISVAEDVLAVAMFLFTVVLPLVAATILVLVAILVLRRMARRSSPALRTT